MTYEKWEKARLGKKTDYDGVYGVQCVDLAKDFIDNVLEVKVQSIGNAIDYYKKRNTIKYLKDNFTWHDYVKGFNFAKGDLIIFKTNSKNGHIAICTGNETSTAVETYDQNYNGKGSGMTLNQHKFSDKSHIVLGVLRPKNQKNLKPAFKKFTGTVSTSAQNLNIRSSASTANDDNIVGKLAKGSKIAVVGESGKFYKVTYKNKTCYAVKEFIK